MINNIQLKMTLNCGNAPCRKREEQMGVPHLVCHHNSNKQSLPNN